MKKNLLILIITILIIPQITLASWWNPFTWFDKEKPTLAPGALKQNTFH